MTITVAVGVVAVSENTGGSACNAGLTNLGEGDRSASSNFPDERRTVGLLKAPQSGSVSPDLFFGESIVRTLAAVGGSTSQSLLWAAESLPTGYDSTRHEYIRVDSYCSPSYNRKQ